MPISEEEPLVEKATTETKTPWRRLACMSAVVSLALGAAAATALRTASGTSMRPAGAAQTMLNHEGCNGDTAYAYWSKESKELLNALNDGGPGFIFRARYDGLVPCDQTHYDGTNGFDQLCGNPFCNGNTCGVPATVLSNWVVTPNPVYCIQNKNGCDSPSVGYAVLDHWTMKGGDLGGLACYPVWKSTSV